VKDAMSAYVSEAQKFGCPSRPASAVTVFDEEDRPQPRLDRDLQNGYTVSVGRAREDESGIFDIKSVVWFYTCCKIAPSEGFHCGI
jgi:aspartate-semialdehyde dehydrogenase